MQLDIAAIKGGFPEGVWLNAVFRFLLEQRYLTVVFQGDETLTALQVRLREVGNDNGGKFPAERGLHRIYLEIESAFVSETQLNDYHNNSAKWHLPDSKNRS